MWYCLELADDLSGNFEKAILSLLHVCSPMSRMLSISSYLVRNSAIEDHLYFYWGCHQSIANRFQGVA